MVNYIRDGQGKPLGVSSAEKALPVVGAYLVRRRMSGTNDQWRLETDLGRLILKPAQEVVYGDQQEVENELIKRYSANADDCTFLTCGCEYGGAGWTVEHHPVLTTADPAALMNVCMVYKKALVQYPTVTEMGGRDQLIQAGFLVDDRPSRDAYLVRFNPRAVAMRRWRQDVSLAERFLPSELPPNVTEHLWDRLRPGAWGEHPYASVLKSEGTITCREKEKIRGEDGRIRVTRVQKNDPQAAEKLLALIEITGKLFSGQSRCPWRKRLAGEATSAWREVLKEAVQYIHGVESKGDKQWKKLVRWIRKEARAAKVRIPRRPKLPPKPKFKSARVRKDHELAAMTHRLLPTVQPAAEAARPHCPYIRTREP